MDVLDKCGEVEEGIDPLQPSETSTCEARPVFRLATVSSLTIAGGKVNGTRGKGCDSRSFCLTFYETELDGEIYKY